MFKTLEILVILNSMPGLIYLLKLFVNYRVVPLTLVLSHNTVKNLSSNLQEKTLLSKVPANAPDIETS